MKIHPKASTNYCIDIGWGGTQLAYSSGTALQIWGCSGNANQAFSLDPSTQMLKAYKNTPQELCIQSNPATASVKTAQCASIASQKWTFDSATGLLKDGNNKCFALPSGGLYNGMQVQSTSCTGGGNMQWAFGQ